MSFTVRADQAAPSLIRLTLISEDGRNELDLQSANAITAAFAAAECGGEITAVTIESSGQVFCSGLALSALEGDQWLADAQAVQSALLKVATSPLVTISVVDGAAVGGGVALAASCDQVIVSPRATFCLTELLIGLIPAIALPIVARRVGQQPAFRMALLTTEVTAREALAMGLADSLWDDPARGVSHVLRRLRAADDGAIRALKRYFRTLTGSELAPEQALWFLEERVSEDGVARRLAALRAAGLAL